MDRIFNYYAKKRRCLTANNKKSRKAFNDPNTCRKKYKQKIMLTMKDFHFYGIPKFTHRKELRHCGNIILNGTKEMTEGDTKR